jgi:hypothetical protein
MEPHLGSHPRVRLNRSTLAFTSVPRSLGARLAEVARPVIGGAVFAPYVAISGALLTHVLLLTAGGQGEPNVENSLAVRPARVVVGISVIDGPTVHCETSSDRVTADVIGVCAAHLPRIYRELGCAVPAPAGAPVEGESDAG